MPSLRRTIVVLPEQVTFWHDVYPKPPAPVRRCTTERPQRVCMCDQYNLTWLPREEPLS